VDYRLKKETLRTEMGFWRRAARSSKILKLKNEIIRDKMGVTLTIMERLENNTIQCCGHGR
jgi:hypothetical protein